MNRKERRDIQFGRAFSINRAYHLAIVEDDCNLYQWGIAGNEENCVWFEFRDEFIL